MEHAHHGNGRMNDTNRYTAITLERDGDVALLWLDQQGSEINTISAHLLQEFTDVLVRIEDDPEIRAAILISRKPDNFIAGADLTMFQHVNNPEEVEALSREGNQILLSLENLSKPVIAAINGSALGGGLEVAMACHYRIASDHESTVFGQPEVKLGLLPGAGGTQRLPRLVGLKKSLPILLTGKNVYPKHALKIGLIDELVPAESLIHAARKVAGQSLEEIKNSSGKRQRSVSEWLLEGNPIGRRLVFKKARQRTKEQTRGNYPAPFKIIDCVETGYREGLIQGLDRESRSFGELAVTPEAQQLIHLFFSMKRARKNPLPKQARPISSLGVLGAGLMGAGIAQISVENGLRTVLKDVDRDALSRGQQQIWKELARKVSKGALQNFERDRVFSRLYSTVDNYPLADQPLIIEAVFEDLELKKRLLRQMEELLPGDAILASNTSALPIKQLAEGLKRPGQIIGMHYFSPVPRMPLVEIVVTRQTRDWVVATAIEVGIRQGKHCIVVLDGPGFYTTRILAPFLNEAMTILEEGARIEDVDQAMLDYGFPVGPLALLDEIGIDVGAHVAASLGRLFIERGYTPSNAADRLFKSGYKGRKNNRGFYQYRASKRRDRSKKVNTEIYSFFGGSKRREFDHIRIQTRLILSMLNEAAYCLQEGILQSPEDGDLGAVLGLGFPPFKGGPFRVIDEWGADEILREMETYDREGLKLAPAEILRQHATQKKTFYSH